MAQRTEKKLLAPMDLLLLSAIKAASARRFRATVADVALSGGYDDAAAKRRLRVAGLIVRRRSGGWGVTRAGDEMLRKLRAEMARRERTDAKREAEDAATGS